MALQTPRRPTPAFESWIPLARQVVRTSLRLGWKDVFTIYTYPSTIPLAEALALEARRVGSDTHLTLTPERAETYGLDYEKWHSSYHKALAVDLKEIQREGRALARALRGRKKVRIDSAAGTDLRFETKDIATKLSDGIISPEDIHRGFVRTALPAGRLEAPVRPQSVEGEIRGTDPTPFAGRAIVRPRFRIESGRIVESGAAEQDQLLHRMLKQSKSESARIGYFTIRLNAAAAPRIVDNSIVKDDVGLGLGPHPELERGIVDPTVSFNWTVGPVRIEIGR